MTIIEHLDVEAVSARGEPRYLAIADEIASRITSGDWTDGTRLPTHRSLASDLGVTVGTVSRAYAELERRGLVRGEVGRGTFVGSSGSEDLLTPPAPSEQASIDLGRSYPVPIARDDDLARALRAIAATPRASLLLRYDSERAFPEHGTAATRWLERSGLDITPDRVIVTGGAQHALMVALSTVLKPGDRLGVEELTFPGVKAVARLLGCKLEPLRMDGEGVLPSAVEAACRAGVRVFSGVPSLHNPTNAVMSEERRGEIADILRRHDALFVEDDLFGLLLSDPLPPLAALSPDHVLYLTSLSKTVAPGLRVGYLVVPPSLIAQAANTLRATCWMVPPLMVEVATRWIDDGVADALLARQRKELAARRRLAREVLGDWEVEAPEGAAHLWFRLPAGWATATFVDAARAERVILTTEAPFLVPGAAAPNAVRLCIGAPATSQELERALRRIAGVLRAGPEAISELPIV